MSNFPAIFKPFRLAVKLVDDCVVAALTEVQCLYLQLLRRSKAHGSSVSAKVTVVPLSQKQKVSYDKMLDIFQATHLSNCSALDS
jgi:hypothetical protein